MGCRWGAKLQEVSPRHHHSAPHAWRVPPSQVAGSGAKLVQQVSVPRAPAFFWHQLKTYLPIILAPPWLQGL